MSAIAIATVSLALANNLPINTAALTYYYDPAIFRNKLTPLSIFRDVGLRKRDAKKFMFYLYVLYRVYTNIQK